MDVDKNHFQNPVEEIGAHPKNCEDSRKLREDFLKLEKKCKHLQERIDIIDQQTIKWNAAYLYFFYRVSGHCSIIWISSASLQFRDIYSISKAGELAKERHCKRYRKTPETPRVH